MIKTKESKDYTPTVAVVYNLISKRYGYTARLTDIWDLLKTAFTVKEFDILEPTSSLNGPFQSYLIDEQIKWSNGEEIDFKDIADAILKAGDFTNAEKRMFSDGNIEERLWAIMLAVTNPELNIEVNLK